ncbi:MAG: TIGR04255 family protein [Nitrospiria bacterium]
MVGHRHLDKAPITEALVDIRVKLRPDIDLSTLESTYALFASEYPEKRKRIRVESKGDFKTRKSETTSVVDGYLCTSSEKKQVVQVRLDGFTFSRLKPYTTWEDLRKEALRLWQLYIRLVSPELITRVALRYINRLEIPLPIRDFGDYLTAPPTIPQNLPQELTSFLTRNVIRERSLNFVAIISQSLEPVGASNVVPVILDIDVFKEVQYNVGTKEIWETIDQLREFKNKIFFESITDKIVELYK